MNKYVESDIKITIDFPKKKILLPEYLNILVCFYKYLKAHNNTMTVKVNWNEYNKATYAARMNFFQEIEQPFKENFVRHETEYRFKEITMVDEDNNYLVTDDLMFIVKKNTEILSSVVKTLNFCLYEIIDNIRLHSESTINGFVSAQNYPQRQELHLTIVDAGIGIYNALTSASEYSQLTEKEAIEYALKKGVTDGKGAGNGLYYTTEFMKKNLGEMQIHSGNRKLEITKGKLKNKEASFWNGTIIHLNIKTDSDIDMLHLFDGNLPTSVEEAFEEEEEVTISIHKKKKGTGLRSEGKYFRELINDKLKSNLKVILDFKGVEMVSISFADEIFGKLYTKLGASEFNNKVKILNANEIIKVIINQALTDQKKKDKK